MLKIQNISLPIDMKPSKLKGFAAKALRVQDSEIAEIKYLKKSLDARHKDNIKYIYTLGVALDNEEQVLKRCGNKNVSVYEPFVYEVPKLQQGGSRPVVVGFGPAGIFAARVLSIAGLNPIVLERGDAIAARRKSVEGFWKNGVLDVESNVQFGEGGAGAFSDCKLNTGTHDKRISWVLQSLHEAGAPENIIYDAKPHIGTDVCSGAVSNIRAQIEEAGGEVRFRSKLCGIKTEGGKLSEIVVSSPEGEYTLPCDCLVLALGHSARDTFEMLKEAAVPMEQKGFSIGVRIEHLQENVGRCQYGASYIKLPAADYSLNCRLADGRNAYTFCMSPGGYVIAAASEENSVVTNGMSYSGRAGENANSALLVNIGAEDFPSNDVLAGVALQREIERRAYEVSGSYKAPAQRVGDFLDGVKSTGAGSIKPTYEPDVFWCDLAQVLPPKIAATLRDVLKELSKKSPIFADMDAVLTAPETRSSSPVRILRNPSLESEIEGLYPCGEGAGYAGGIVSAAVDGMRCAEAVMKRYTK